MKCARLECGLFPQVVGGKSSAVGLFLMFCREWWLLLLPNNSAATFLMLTGLHIHLSALGGLGAPVSLRAHFKAMLATRSRAFLSCVFFFWFLARLGQDALDYIWILNRLCSMIVCYSSVAVTKPPVSDCDKNRRRQKKQQGTAPEELWCKQRRPSRPAKPSVKSLQQLFSNTAKSPPSSAAPAKPQRPQENEKWRILWLHTQLPKGY